VIIGIMIIGMDNTTSQEVRWAEEHLPRGQGTLQCVVLWHM